MHLDNNLAKVWWFGTIISNDANLRQTNDFLIFIVPKVIQKNNNNSILLLSSWIMVVNGAPRHISKIENKIDLSCLSSPSCFTKLFEEIIKSISSLKAFNNNSNIIFWISRSACRLRLKLKTFHGSITTKTEWNQFHLDGTNEQHFTICHLHLDSFRNYDSKFDFHPF